MNCKKHKEYVEDCADCIWGTDHQEVARKNQESEDLAAARFYFKLYHRVDINPEAVPEAIQALRKLCYSHGMEGDAEFRNQLMPAVRQILNRLGVE